ncbi:hypothetical protein ABEB36_012876 [Hypothenemus hampei]|uniref:Uncharacterized protein n=1 Tax=Hypothenemus hampei TaxID=57062 RepID=A0ABD1EAJ9_HYPHA
MEGKNNAEENRLHKENKDLTNRLAKLEAEANDSKKMEGRVEQLEKEREEMLAGADKDVEHEKNLMKKGTTKHIEQIMNKPKEASKNVRTF